MDDRKYVIIRNMSLSEIPERRAEAQAVIPRSCVKTTVNHLLILVGRALHHAITGQLTKGEALHPDFRNDWEIEGIAWYQNRDWGPMPPPP